MFEGSGNEFSMQISAIYIALCGLLMLILAARVATGRIKYELAVGDGGIRSFQGVIRAHSDAVEYIPMALLMLVAAENSGAEGWMIHGLGTLLLASRVVHALALYRTPDASKRRFVGVFGTWMVYVLSALLILAGQLS